MDIYRIKAQHIQNGVPVPGQFLELVAGLTSPGFIAQGDWYGVVVDQAEFHPFVLTQNGYCQYAGDKTQVRHCTIVARPVVVDEIFEITWADAEDRYGYQVVSVGRLNA